MALGVVLVLGVGVLWLRVLGLGAPTRPMPADPDVAADATAAPAATPNRRGRGADTSRSPKAGSKRRWRTISARPPSPPGTRRHATIWVSP